MAIAPEEEISVKTDTSSGVESAAKYGISEALFADKIYGNEIKAIYKLFKAGNTGAALEALFKSNYYTKTSAVVKTRLKQELEQPEVYLKSVESYGLAARKRLVTSGIKVNQTEFNAIIAKAYKDGLDDNQLDQVLLTSGKITGFGGGILGDTEALKVYANSFGVTQYLDKNYWNSKSKDLFAGTVTAEDIEAEIRMKSASAFPSYAEQINNGTSVDAIASAYKGAISSILEIDPDSITYSNPYLRQALQAVGPDGKPITKPLWQFERELRTTNEWEYTNNARDTMDTLSLKVLRDLGLA